MAARIHLCIAHGCSGTGETELNSGDKDHLACKSQDITDPLQRKLLAPVLSCVGSFSPQIVKELLNPHVH